MARPDAPAADDILRLPARQQAALIARRELSPVELCINYAGQMFEMGRERPSKREAT